MSALALAGCGGDDPFTGGTGGAGPGAGGEGGSAPRAGRTGGGGSTAGASGGAGRGGSAGTAGASGTPDAGAGGAAGTGGGNPGSDAGPGQAPDVAVVAPSSVVINEIMYHPVLENADQDNHEFLELHNRGMAPVSVAGWKLTGDVSFTFPAGASIPAGGFAVLAKNKTALVALYKLDPALVAGEYMSQLDNGSGKLSLTDAAGTVIDAVAWGSAFPWPMAPDALGAGEGWIAKKWGTEQMHQYKGFSLERVSADVPAAELANWAPSMLDGATPGKANGAAAPMPLPVVEHLEVTPMGKTSLPAAAADKVQVLAKFSARGTVKSAEVEFQIEDVNKPGGAFTAVPMTMGATGWQALLPAQKENSVVRYRIFADRGKGREQVAPRPSDPMDTFAYWVASPTVKEGSYQLFIALKDWTQMWKNIEPGMVPEVAGKAGCVPNTSWDERVPATLVVNGQVYDVRVRHSGSRWNRQKGWTLTGWPTAELPTGPSPMRALSWNIKLPRYAQHERRKTISLNKLLQSCPGMQPALGARLFSAAGIPAPQVKRFTRLYINGRYYHYMMDIEHADDDMLKRHFGAGTPGAGAEFIKANSGMYGDEGPWGIADGRPLAPMCNFNLAQRYASTWERKNYEWRNHDELHKMFTELAAAGTNATAIKAVYAKYFDVDKALTYFAIRNWMAAWDDTYHNYMLYRVPESGKWAFSPLDMDLEFGAFTFNATSSFMLGTKSAMNMWMQWGTFKETMLNAYRPEFEKKLKDLAAGILATEKVNAMLDEEAAKYSATEFSGSPAKAPIVPAGGADCALPSRISQMKTFVRDRNAAVSRLP